jgi:hypothetical protein
MSKDIIKLINHPYSLKTWMAMAISGGTAVAIASQTHNLLISFPLTALAIGLIIWSLIHWLILSSGNENPLDVPGEWWLIGAVCFAGLAWLNNKELLDWLALVFGFFSGIFLLPWALENTEFKNSARKIGGACIVASFSLQFLANNNSVRTEHATNVGAPDTVAQSSRNDRATVIRALGFDPRTTFSDSEGCLWEIHESWKMEIIPAEKVGGDGKHKRVCIPNGLGHVPQT